MVLSNTATPKYYGEFREKVLRNKIKEHCCGGVINAK